MASVWGVSAIIGPLAGAFIVQHIAWAWVFWINVPLGILAVAGLMAFLHENVERHDHPIDWQGAGLFSVGVTALLLAISPDAGGGILSHPLIFAAIFAVCAPLFFWQERRAKEPMMELGLWADPVVASANGATLAAGLALIGLTASLPIYIQAVLGKSPIVAGLTLTVMAVGWPIAATASARLFLPWLGMRSTLRAGAATMVVGAFAFPFVDRSNGLWLFASGALLMGWGMGMMTYASVMLLQAVVHGSKRGAANASNVFARLLGNTLGAAMMGAILNLGLHMAGAKPTSEQVRALMDRNTGGAALKAADPVLKAALEGSLHWVFLATTALSVLTLAAAWAMPPPNVAEPFRRRAIQPKAAE